MLELPESPGTSAHNRSSHAVCRPFPQTSHNAPGKNWSSQETGKPPSRVQAQRSATAAKRRAILKPCRAQVNTHRYREKKEGKNTKTSTLRAGQETDQSSTRTVKLGKGLAQTSSRQTPQGEGPERLRKPHPKGPATLGPLKIKLVWKTENLSCTHLQTSKH